MDLAVTKLEEFGLEEFIKYYRFYLCKRTISSKKIAVVLGFDFDQSAIIDQPPDKFSKCERLYELIQKTATATSFLDALEKSGNGHLINFINSAHFSGSTLANPIGIWFNIPEPIESFYGREDFLAQLHVKLKPRDDSETAPQQPVTVLSQVRIVSGLGGIGKTETATQYIIKHKDFYNNFIWINAESANSLSDSFLKLADKLKIPVVNPQNQNQNQNQNQGRPREIKDVVMEIYNKICGGGKSNLIVFDNAEDFQSCQDFLPFGLDPDLTKPVILATSRNQEWISRLGRITVLPLDVLTDDESLEFILKELEIPDSERVEFTEESKEFIELLGGLPLALQQAVAYIRNEKELQKFLGKSYKISDYVHEFKSSMKKFQEFSPVPQSAPDSSPTVYVTWNVTLLKFFKLANGEEAIKILAHLSFLYADKIPCSFLRDFFPEMENRTFAEALKLIEKYSLIKSKSKAEFCLSIHRQLQFVILQYLQESEDISKVVPNLVEKCSEIVQKTQLSKSSFSNIFLNFHQIVNNQFSLVPINEKFIIFMYQFATVLSIASRFPESLDLYQKVYKQQLQLWGENHLIPLVSRHQIAVQLSELRRSEEALNLHREILEKHEARLGGNHSLMISTKYNIAKVLQAQEKYQESLELAQKVLDQQTKTQNLGENHPETLITLNMVAVIQFKLKNYPKALALFEELEQKQLLVLDPNDREIANTKHNKAAVLLGMGQFQEAFTIFNEAYEKTKEILGENHVDTVSTLSWIASSLQNQGSLSEALDKLQQVLECRKRNLGEDHPETINTRYNIATIFREQKRYQESLQLFQRVLAQCNKVYGENHSDTLKCQMQIADLHSVLKNPFSGFVRLS